MQDHTLEKLEVYKHYLINYLSVMRNSRYFDKIIICEPFAGAGINDDGSEGSAAIAARIISDERQTHGKNIRLVLNELKSGKHQQLKEAMDLFSGFTTVTKSRAKDFIDEVTSLLKSGNEKTHLLFFIDPYGYTQYTPHNLQALFQLPRADYLIFVPTNHIYRFRKNRKSGVEFQRILPGFERSPLHVIKKKNNPARKFVLGLGMNEDVLNRVNDIDKFSNHLVCLFKTNAAADFVYSYKLVNKDSNSSVHHLFFITKNARGAEKFLEAKNAVKGSIADTLTLFDFDALEAERFLETALTAETNNERLYIESIKKGFLSKDISPALKAMEKRGEIAAAATFKRRTGDFYLGIKPSKRIILRRIK